MRLACAARNRADHKRVAQEPVGVVEPQRQKRSKTRITKRFHCANLVAEVTLEVDRLKGHSLGGLVVTKDEREVAEVAQRECPRPSSVTRSEYSIASL